mmetsp:Transcript_18763/g.22480  ORF Transcript_18763/g.22480 Transcript_18763/m.22480 type:complete len:105 (+) Transcript_18763:96-410(+)|eukprot:CAMPEP_0197864812 /NCGR_PEP_ID=MMETSP1438-20131217/43305_1 /TAXON_ID=1461541 /ORGANISM="Pterosperma sp., Strain CCMP1384" /LENGTH=104 /DNA_ID=CAMNT_0043483185 /DNA_START=81 /DNA_END=395 /DNA_ORIENTATION=+
MGLLNVSSIMMTFLLFVVVARQAEAVCHHTSTSHYFPAGTCSETEDVGTCNLYNYPSGSCDSAGYPHACVGNYEIVFWYKDEDCGKCKDPSAQGKRCTSTIAAE